MAALVRRARRCARWAAPQGRCRQKPAIFRGFHGISRATACEFVSRWKKLKSVDDRPGKTGGGYHPGNQSVQSRLLDPERTGNSGAAWNLYRYDDPVGGGLDDPTEPPQRDISVLNLGVPEPIDREQNFLEHQLDVLLRPPTRLVSGVRDPFRDRVIALAQHNFDVKSDRHVGCDDPTVRHPLQAFGSRQAVQV
jgi:hypothetical protein